MINKYVFSKLKTKVDFSGDEEFEKRAEEYLKDFDSEDISVIVKRTSGDIDVRKTNLIKITEISYFYSEEDSDILFFFDPNISKVIAKIQFSKDYKKIDISLYKLKELHNVDDVTLMYNVVGTAINYAAFMHRGFVFHSSSVCCDGYGIAFSAKSGTGKSTHTSLWLKNFPGTFILNDDTPMIRLFDDGRFYISGTPWAGTTGINKNVSVPLKALVFLQRGKENSISRIDSHDATPLIFEAIRSPLTNDMFSKTLDTLNLLLQDVPCYILKCNMDPDAAYTAKNMIFDINI